MPKFFTESLSEIDRAYARRKHWLLVYAGKSKRKKKKKRKERRCHATLKEKCAHGCGPRDLME